MYHFGHKEVSLRDLALPYFRPYADDDGESESGLLSEVFVFRTDILSGIANESELSMPRLLLFELCRGFQNHAIKVPVLIFINLRRDQLFLFVCGGKSKVEAGWINEICDCEGPGRDTVHDEAIPFFYWDGQHCFRVYDKGRFPTDEEFLVEDFGTIYPSLYIQGTSEEEFDLINEHPENYEDRNVIPKETSFTIKKGEERVTVTQILVTLTNDPRTENP